MHLLPRDLFPPFLWYYLKGGIRLGHTLERLPPKTIKKVFFVFMLSAGLVLVVFFISGLFSSRGVSSSTDYAVANRKAGVRGVSGVILGSLVGGAATVGTVQMAYQWGLSALWFTLGSGAACLLMGLWFVTPLRSVELITLPQYLGRHFGKRTALLVAVSTASGSFLSVIAQFLSGVALMRSVFPVSTGVAALLTGALILAFVFGGGIKSFSRLGEAKIIFLYMVMLLCAGVVLVQGWTPGAIIEALPSEPFFNILSRGAGKDLGSFASLLCGVLCGQIYIQAVYTASSNATAKKGCLWAAFIIPPMGFLGTWIGLSMRASGVAVEASQALPFFIQTSFHPVLGGLLWSGIMITVLGTAVGVSLGVATNLTRDIFLKMKVAAHFDDVRILLASRVIVLAVVAAAGTVACASRNSMILQWAYLGMGVKASGIFCLMLAAVLRPGRLSPAWSFAAGIGGLLGVAGGAVVGGGLDPLFPGLALSGLVVLIGLSRGRAGTLPGSC